MAVFICAALMFVIAVILSGYTLELKMSGVVAMGRVVDLRPVRGGTTPVIEFADREGQSQRVESGSYSLFGPKVNDSVEVIYFPGNPQSARVNEFETNWGTPVLLCFVATIFVVVAFLARELTENEITALR